MKYRVRLEYHTVLHREVEAESDEKAIEVAESQVSSNEIGLESSSYSADAEELDE